MNLAIVQKFGVSTLRFGLVQSTSRSTFDGGTNYLHLWSAERSPTITVMSIGQFSMSIGYSASIGIPPPLENDKALRNLHAVFCEQRNFFLLK